MAHKTVLQWKEEGNVFFQKQDYQCAIQCYTQALDIDPFNSVVLSNRAECYLQLGSYNDAAKDARRSFTLDDSNIKSALRLARALSLLDRYNEARFTLVTTQLVLLHRSASEASQIQPELGKIQASSKSMPTVQAPMQGDDFVVRGRELMEKREYYEACKEFTKGIRKDPSNVYAYLLRAEVNMRIPNHAHLAYIDTRFVLSSGPISSAVEGKAWRLLAQALVMLGDFTELTILSLKHAIQFSPSPDQSLDTLLQRVTAKSLQAQQEAIQNFGQLNYYTVFTQPATRFYTEQEEVEYLRTLFFESQFMEVRHTQNMGRGVFAKKDIPANLELWVSPPIVAVSFREDLCQNCLVELPKKTVRCTGCEEEVYCSVECKDRAWTQYHRGICRKGIAFLRKFIRDGAVSGSASALLSAVRIMGIILSSKEEWDSVQANQDYCELPQISQMKFISIANNNFKMLLEPMFCWYIVQEIFGMHNNPYFNIEWYMFTCMKILQNAFCDYSHVNAKSRGTRQLIFEDLSFINHSCTPNVRISVTRGILTSTKKILKGEQLFVSYLNPNAPKKERRMNLATYGFECTCAKCAAEI